MSHITTFINYRQSFRFSSSFFTEDKLRTNNYINPTPKEQNVSDGI